MGSAASHEAGIALPFTEVVSWTYSQDVRPLYARFKKHFTCFGMVYANFEALMAEHKPPLQNLAELFGCLDTDHNGRIDALEFFAGLAIICRSTLEDTARFCFELFDFNLNGSLSPHELMLMLRCCATAIQKMLEAKESLVISHESIVKLQKQAFACADTDASNTIEFSEFLTWLRGARDVTQLLDAFSDAKARMRRGASEVDSAGELSESDDPDSDIECELKMEQNLESRRKPAGMRLDAEFGDDEPLAGDEFMAVKPWVGAVKEPSWWKRAMEDPDAPDVDLELQFVHGYRSQDSRNNLRFTRRGEIVFPAAGVGVVYDRATHTQKFFHGHDDDVISLALHPGGNFVATGQLGKRPTIFVWDAHSLQTVSTIKGAHQRGVSLLSFSGDGTMLASVGLDNDHTVAVHDWWDRNGVFLFTFSDRRGRGDSRGCGTLIASAKGHQNKVFSCEFAPDNSQIVLTGAKFVLFFELSGKVLKSRRGILGRKGKLQTFLCSSFVSMVGTSEPPVVVGTASGELYVFIGRQLSKVIKAHAPQTPVFAMYSFSGGLVTGGKDGFVKMWSTRLGPLRSMDMTLSQLESADPCIRSVCVHEGAMLIGTRASEVFVVDERSGDTMKLLQGHFSGEVWGLCAHPSRAVYVTAGDDGSVRIWDATTRRVVRTVFVRGKPRSVAYSPDGSRIAVGCYSGVVFILDGETMATRQTMSHTHEWISDIKYSGDGSVLAVASHDNRIYLYSVLPGDQYQRKGICSGHSSYITHCDFSEDSKYLQSNCGAYELLFWSVTGRQIKSASSLRDVEWSSWTSTLGWPVQGIWEPTMDGTDINAVDRSNCGRLLASGDDFGRVKLFRYPCVSTNASFRHYLGHSSHVTSVRFLQNDSLLLSAGGLDRCIMQWEVHRHETDTVEQQLDHSSDDEFNVDGFSGVNGRGGSLSAEETSLFRSFTDPGAGDEFMAVKPWLGAIVPPSTFKSKRTDNEAPDNELTLEWIHGYRSHDSRNNLRYTASGDIVYPAAGVGVTFRPAAHRQSFMLEHEDDILSLAVHSLGRVIATGEIGAKPSILLWDPDTHTVLSKLRGFHRRGVSHVAFAGEGSLLISIGLDNDHSMAVYDWKQGRMVANCKTDKNKVLGCAVSDDGKRIATCGVRHVKFWSMRGANLRCQKGIFGKAKADTAITAVFVGDRVVTGMSKGSLFVWQGHNVSSSIPAHTGAVNCLHSTGSGLISGGSDGRVVMWQLDGATGALTKTEEFDLHSLKVNCLDPAVRSVCVRSNHLLIGTLGSEIVQMDLRDGSVELLVEGHCGGEVWGLTHHPRQDMYYTAADDGTLRLWDVKKQCCALREKVGTAKWRAVACSPNGQFLALGGMNGELMLVTERMEQIGTRADSKKCIQEMRFSPDGQILAVGSHDQRIYLYGVSESGLQPKSVCRGHSSYITHLDFSEDSQFLQSNCGAYELLFWNVATGKQITRASSLRDVQWSSWTCTLGWPVQGIWPECADGTDINAVDRSHNGKLLATADDFGKVKLFKYPCTEKGAHAKEYVGHSSHVTSVRFMPGDNTLVSVGGNDRCVFQWKTDCLRVEELDDDASMSMSFEHEEGGGSAMQVNDFASVYGRFEEFDAVSAMGGDEFMAVKPWIGAIHSPSKWTHADSENAALTRTPSSSLELEWVYGYRGQDCRNNLRFTSAGCFVYPAAAVGVVYNPYSHSQSFFTGHTDDILSMEIHPDGDIVATGEIGKRPKICVWEASSCRAICTLEGHHARGVSLLSFSTKGNILGSVGLDNDHSLVIYSIPQGTLVAKATNHKDKVLCMAFHPDGKQLVTAGVKHVTFWSLNMQGQKGQLSSRKGIFGRKLGIKVQPVLTAGFIGGQLITGQMDGTVYLWSGRSVAKMLKQHNGPVNAMYSSPTGSLCTGDKSGHIVRWSGALVVEKETDLKDLVTEEDAVLDMSIRSICDREGCVLIGTESGDIVFVGQRGHGRVSLRSHFRGELWGLAVHPIRQLVLTVGDDAVVRVWDPASHKMVSQQQLKAGARAAAFSPDGCMVAVGLTNGTLTVYPTDLSERVGMKKLSAEWISDIKFSPNGMTIAVASHDNRIYLVDSATFAVRSVCRGHSSYITHLDFSEDSQFLQSNCGAYELLFWNVATGKQITRASSLRDVQWSSWTCTLGWPVQGIWPECADGTDINAVDRSHNGKLLATADDFGKVKLFKYPCLDRKAAQSRVYTGHSSHVTNIRFAAGDRYVVSVGGNDRCLFQFQVSL